MPVIGVASCRLFTEAFMNPSYSRPRDEPSPSAYTYPLLVKQLLHMPLATRRNCWRTSSRSPIAD
ncbi:hypothetical protein PI86_11075 [Burkholderia sp. A9]|nr:hypothetical protein PI86_11075 [Burkholderia sp. A9]